MLKVRYFSISWKNICSFWLWWQQHISKKLEQGDVYHCVSSRHLLTTVCKHLGGEETSFWSLKWGMLSWCWCRILCIWVPEETDNLGKNTNIFCGALSRRATSLTLILSAALCHACRLRAGEEIWNHTPENSHRA